MRLYLYAGAALALSAAVGFAGTQYHRAKAAEQRAESALQRATAAESQRDSLMADRERLEQALSTHRAAQDAERSRTHEDSQRLRSVSDPDECLDRALPADVGRLLTGSAGADSAGDAAGSSAGPEG